METVHVKYKCLTAFDNKFYPEFNKNIIVYNVFCIYDAGVIVFFEI